MRRVYDQLIVRSGGCLLCVVVPAGPLLGRRLVSEGRARVRLPAVVYWLLRRADRVCCYFSLTRLFVAVLVRVHPRLSMASAISSSSWRVMSRLRRLRVLAVYYPATKQRLVVVKHERNYCMFNYF